MLALGLLAVVGGVAFYSLPAAIIVGGLALVAMAVSEAYGGK